MLSLVLRTFRRGNVSPGERLTLFKVEMQAHCNPRALLLSYYSRRDSVKPAVLNASLDCSPSFCKLVAMVFSPMGTF